MSSIVVPRAFGRTFVSLASVILAAAVGLGCPESSRAADPPVVDEELAKACERLLRQRFYRHGSAVFEHVTRDARLPADRVTPADRFLRAFYEGRWAEVRDTLAKLPPEMGNGIYDKMLADLTDRQTPILTLDDFLGLADAVPGELNSQRIRWLGLLLRVAVPKEQELWLQNALEKGTRQLGRSPEKRLATGRILLHADFDGLAREYLPAAAEANQIEEAEVRDEVLNFLASQEELEAFQQTRIAGLWKQQARILNDSQADSLRVQQAAEQLAELLGRAPPGSTEVWLRNLMQADLDAALLVASALGRKAQGKTSDRDVLLRTNYLLAQRVLLRIAGEVAKLDESPWNQVAAAMAEGWIQEAEHTFNAAPSYRSSGPARPFVATGDLLEAAPAETWAAVLPASLRDRIDVCLSKAILVSDRYEEAVSRIVELAARNAPAGLALAEEYLQAWAHRHNPEVPESIRKQYQLPGDARIMVTPVMMEKNIASLAEMMKIFRQHGIHPRNGNLLVEAFDVCYSQAEVYRRSHIETVFGPADAMDEDIFLHMIRTLSSGLGSRWRKLELQEASGTRRTGAETLQMVREGYQAAIEMIEQWSARHPGAWRGLLLAGSLSSDWAQFEYAQQLVAESNLARMEGYQGQSEQAEAFFTRAAEVYAAQVPELRPGAYSIDVYLAWFHSLLGIDSGGELGIAKPLDRRALNKIRDLVRALPGPAGQAHVDRLAKYVSARLEDTTRPLHESLKYKYLAGSLVITQESPFSFQARDKVNYYDELLDEIHLETRVDGPSTVQRDQEFGILLTVRHTEAMGRMADFGKYLVNETPPSPKAGAKPPPAAPISVGTGFRPGQIRGRRDELETSIREALSLFFEVKSITFSPRDVRPRATERPGWEETVLAYLHVKALDASVDKIPRIQLSLEFLDLTGPVAISAESAETMIKMIEQPSPPRPFHQVDITQILDARQLAATDEVLLEVTATANGLVPDLPVLLDLEALAGVLPIARLDPQEGTLIREIDSWGDTVHATSSRSWTIALDASALRDSPRRVALRLPRLKVADGTLKSQTYRDMDLVDLAEPVVVVGYGVGEVETPTVMAYAPWQLAAGAGGAVAMLLLLAWIAARFWRRSGPRPVRARDLFRMPARVDGFVVVQLLRALAASPLVRLTAAQQVELQQEIERIQQACFGRQTAGLSEAELRGVAGRWLKFAR